jgi:hypothetical protein
MNNGFAAGAFCNDRPTVKASQLPPPPRLKPLASKQSKPSMPFGIFGFASLLFLCFGSSPKSQDPRKKERERDKTTDHLCSTVLALYRST